VIIRFYKMLTVQGFTVRRETENKQRNEKEAQEDLRKSRERLRALGAHLQSVREEERTQIARELHDELGQVLAALKMDMALLKKELSQPSNRMPRRTLTREIASMGRLVERSILAVHRITSELRPAALDHLDLKEAMEWQIQEFRSRSGIAGEFHSNVNNMELDRKSATALFRILQEALINIARHSNASHVYVSLEEKDGILNMAVTDNGKGITEADISDAKSFGLLGIKERALLLGGEVEISGAPGEGTTVTLRVSLAELRLPGEL
jgi:signal transduction histidine kinase